MRQLEGLILQLLSSIFHEPLFNVDKVLKVNHLAPLSILVKKLESQF